MKHFTDKLLEDYVAELEPQWVELFIEPWRFNFLAKNWSCPKNKSNRNILSEDEWLRLKDLFIQAGKNVNVNKKAELVSTYYNEYGKSYLVWLNFTDTNGESHLIDVYINELDSKKNKNAEKFIDIRSPLCKDVLSNIFETGHISVDTAKLLSSIGSVTWEGTPEAKVQKKLNSYIQASIFESACDKVGVKYKQLDSFDGYLYRGDPGQLADYDLTFNDGTTVRVDLKLIQSSTDLSKQNPHDAELLISSDWRTDEVKYHRVSGKQAVEYTEQFKELLKAFSEEQKSAGKCFIHINNINTETGDVDYVKF